MSTVDSRVKTLKECAPEAALADLAFILGNPDDDPLLSDVSDALVKHRILHLIKITPDAKILASDVGFIIGYKVVECAAALRADGLIAYFGGGLTLTDEGWQKLDSLGNGESFDDASI